jgi:hypothetical protein
MRTYPTVLPRATVAVFTLAWLAGCPGDSGSDGDDGDDGGVTSAAFDDGGAETGDGGDGADAADAADVTGGGGGGGVVCPGTTYMRTDDPGTAICLDGSNTFECAWGSGNADVDGVVVDGVHDAGADVLTLCFPDDPTNTTCTDFSFSMLYGLGPDLVLDYMGSRSGDYEQVGSWAEATAGDGGVCSGSGGGGDGGADTGVPPSGTCELPCVGDVDCDAGEACLTTLDGHKCLPQECQGCFEAGSSCLSNAVTCEFGECGPVDPNFSDTCEEPCNSEVDCNAGEACLTLADVGNVCVPAECQSCFDGGQPCSWNGASCEFTACQLNLLRGLSQRPLAAGAKRSRASSSPAEDRAAQ